MKILFVVRTVGYGGASKQLVMMANALHALGHEVCIYSYTSSTILQPISDGVKYIPENNADTNSLLEYIHAPIRIRKVVKKEKPNVVVAWRANAGMFTILACIGLHTPIIFSERSDPYMETNWMLKIATKMCQLSDGGIFQTEKARAFYRKLESKSIVIPNPVLQTTQILPPIPLNERKKEIAFVGRFSMNQKRQDIMIDAFRIIHDQLPDYKLSFYGDGPDMASVKEIVSNYNIEDSVVFHGVVDNVLDRLRTSRVMVLSSDYEGIPNVIIEAFQAGTPVVSTDCSPGGARILISDGENGFIVPVRDAEMLAKQTIKVIENIKLSTEFIEKGREKIKCFAPAIIYPQVAKYLESFIR